MANISADPVRMPHFVFYDLLCFRHFFGKTIFALSFTLNKYVLFRLIMSEQNPLILSISVLCSQIVTIKLKCTDKNVVWRMQMR